MTTENKLTGKGGPGRGQGRKPLPPGRARTKRLTIGTRQDTIDEVDAIVRPVSMSRYVSQLIEQDLDRRRFERHSHVEAVNVSGVEVVVKVPVDDVPLWTWGAWQLRGIDDTEGTAVLFIEHPNEAEAAGCYQHVTALVEAMS